jgi:hypothetical protein
MERHLARQSQEVGELFLGFGMNFLTKQFYGASN